MLIFDSLAIFKLEKAICESNYGENMKAISVLSKGQNQKSEITKLLFFSVAEPILSGLSGTVWSILFCFLVIQY